MTDTSIRKWIDITESNLRNIITSTWKRANRHQLIKTSHFELLFGNARSRTAYKVSEKTNVTVMMENNELVTMNVDSVRPTYMLYV